MSVDEPSNPVWVRTPEGPRQRGPEEESVDEPKKSNSTAGTPPSAIPQSAPRCVDMSGVAHQASISRYVRGALGTRGRQLNPMLDLTHTQ